MELDAATDAFQALGHKIRLKVFQLLMREGPSGLPAGKIAQILDVAPSTLSLHLHVLRRAGLLKSSRSQQRINYAADIEGIRQLLGFLTNDCCNGQPEICGGLMDLKEMHDT